jgi:general secretion pathway protein E
MILPVAKENGTLTLATYRPLPGDFMEDLVRAVDMKVQAVVCSRTDILRLIDEFFGFQRSIAAAEH